MKLRSCWHAAAVATCAVALGCGRNPPSAPEKAADATPAQEPVVAVVPAGEHSDPSLVDSNVTANLDVNAPWTSSSATPQASAPAPDQGQQAAAPPSDEPRAAQRPDAAQASAPAEPANTGASPQAAVEAPNVDLAKSGEDSRTSSN